MWISSVSNVTKEVVVLVVAVALHQQSVLVSLGRESQLSFSQKTTICRKHKIWIIRFTVHRLSCLPSLFVCAIVVPVSIQSVSCYGTSTSAWIICKSYSPLTLFPDHWRHFLIRRENFISCNCGETKLRVGLAANNKATY